MDIDASAPGIRPTSLGGHVSHTKGLSRSERLAQFGTLPHSALAQGLAPRVLTAGLNETIAKTFSARAMQWAVLPAPASPLPATGLTWHSGAVQDFQSMIGRTFDLSHVMPRFNTWEHISQLLRGINPPNWPEDVSLRQMFDLIATTGWSLTYVPRAEVVQALLDAEPNERVDVLLGHAAEIVTDCRHCLDDVSEATAPLRDMLLEALTAYEAGFTKAAQASVAAALTAILEDHLGLRCGEAREELAEDPGQMPMCYMHFWLVASLVPAALAQFHRHRGDPVPTSFNRHASVHTVDPRQYTPLNALVGLMLATSLLKAVDEDWAEDHEDDVA